MIVDEWDEFELELYEQKIEEVDRKNKKENDNMKERNFLIRLSKAFNNAEIQVNGIQTQEEFDAEVEWAKAKLFKIMEGFPNQPLADNTPVKQTTKEYVRDNVKAEKPLGQYTASDIQHNFHKGKQTSIIVKGLNDGKVTIQEVNSTKSWDDTQAIIQKCFAK